MKKLNKIEKENKPEVENETGSRKEIEIWTNISSKTLKKIPLIYLMLKIFSFIDCRLP